MSDDKNHMNPHDLFVHEIERKAEQKLNAKKQKKQSIWFGMGMFGMIGWSVTVPTLLGIAGGIWLDKTFKLSFSWTLNGLIVGLLIGCFIAWNWVSKEHKDIHKKGKNE